MSSIPLFYKSVTALLTLKQGHVKKHSSGNSWVVRPYEHRQLCGVRVDIGR